MDEDSTKRKKKRGKSLIFRKCFRTSSSVDSGKILASDDNLVYCDVANNPVEPEIKKSPSTRGRMSHIFKAVLFDIAVKKKMCEKKSSKTSTDTINSSPGRDEKAEKIENSLNDNNSNVEKVLEADNSSNDNSRVNSLSSEDVASETETLVLSSEISSINTSSQILTQRKATSRVNSVDKKPPLPNSQPSVKLIPAKDTKHVTLNNATFRLYLFILIGIFVLAVMWMSYTAIATESLDIESDQYPNLIIVADEL